MPISRSQVALNAIQWINLKPKPDEEGERIWLYNDPRWRVEQPRVHRQVKEAGFQAVMLEVLKTQTLQAYGKMVDEVGLMVAPGYAQIGLPEDFGVSLVKGSREWVHWFDAIRRKAEETNFVGLDSVFLAAAMVFDDNPRVSRETATGAYFDQGRLDRLVDYIGEAASVLKAEGVRAGLHNHVGTWIETEYEIDYVLGAIEPGLLGASLDIGHLAWAGIDYRAMLRKHAGRLLDLHVKDMDLGIAAASRATPSSYFSVSNQRFFLEPGLGDIDLEGAIADLDALNFTGWFIIEVDRPSMEPFASAQHTWKWIEEHIPE